ncbi:hypothetical protein [Mesorhizobium sp. M0676]|uniref:hypothetical protein n=1 Tax=Mesorhizobium sp. M0676 TaxID=2956984 RepID=UPI0033381117
MLHSIVEEQQLAIMTEESSMTEDSLPPGWATAAAEYMSRNQQCFDDAAWEHTFTSAYQMSCEALVALGYADETEWGAIPLKNSKLPDDLPRWDDVCVAVVKLADQRGALQLRLMDGSLYLGVPLSRPLTIVAPAERWSPPTPNIAGAQGLGLAYALPDVQSVLLALGLTSDAGWTKAAETIFWRAGHPPGWAVDFQADRRFSAAAERACADIPDDVREELDRLSTVTDKDIDTTLAKNAARYQELRSQYGPNAKIHVFTTNEQARRSLESGRRHDLDWLFFRRWRLGDGWLSADQAKRALEIFHDPLAMAMRRTVMGQLYPDLPYLSER